MYINVDGNKTYFYSGSRPFDARLPSIVFIHGAGLDHTVWVLQSRYFAHHGFNSLAVDLPGHPLIVRRPANEIQPDNDLGDRLVTRGVGKLSHHEVAKALDAGARKASTLLEAGLIEGAALHLQGKTDMVALKNINEETILLRADMS